MSEMWRAALELPAQLRWAVAIAPPDVPSVRLALVAGMGGSGIAGDFAALEAERSGGLVAVHKGYGLPGWVEGLGGLVVAVSYSGNTEETLSVAEEARKAGVPVAAVSSGGRLAGLAEEHGWPWVEVPGGLQPRAAVGYLAGAVLRILESAGPAPEAAGALEEAAEAVEARLGADATGPAVTLARDLAEGLSGRVPIIYGGLGPGSVAAQRWKTQINENAKMPAFWSVLPELDHNELEGWTATLPAAGRLGVVLLRDRAGHPRVELRFDLTSRLMGPRVVGEVWAEGEGPLARAFSLTTVGDLASVLLAEEAGVDPLPVDTLERLKQELAEH